MLEKLAMWYLSKKKYSVVLNVEITSNEIIPKGKNCIFKGSTINKNITLPNLSPPKSLEEICKIEEKDMKSLIENIENNEKE